jgi:hypothetical protein
LSPMRATCPAHMILDLMSRFEPVTEVINTVRSKTELWTSTWWGVFTEWT